MSRVSVSRSLALALCVALVLIGAAPAAAAERGLVPAPALVDGVALLGMTEVEARAAIAANTEVPPLADLDVVVDATTWTLETSGAVIVDVEAMLDEAYASTATDPFTLTTVYAVDPGAVAGLLAPIAAATDVAAVSARHYAVGRTLRVAPSSPGRRLDRTGAAASITAALLASAGGGGAAQPAITLSVLPVAPAVTEATLGRAILISLVQRKLYLYNGAALEKVYRCAIGMRRYPTPRGAFKVIGKKVMPRWNNPGSRWARGMPRFIKPGPRNPLGTRALYLSAPGIRIHGTPQPSSIGRAASHGCVRMLRKDIERMYPLIPVGTKVFIVN
jgi:lipoprotein-anchoring transpeptidase ErfK/SrfK